MLKNLDVHSIIHRYGLETTSSEPSGTLSKTTKISDLVSSDVEQMVSFLDETRKPYATHVTMLDHVREKTLPDTIGWNCFWCRHPFSTRPIGCPIRYVNSCLEKSYVSHITKDKYNMKENVTPDKLASITACIRERGTSDHVQITPNKNDYYLTDGVFCSFNCVGAFVKEKSTDPFYKESASLLQTLYYSFFNKKMPRLIPAPSWRLLEEYGGHLTISKFRQTFCLVEYERLFPVCQNLEDTCEPVQLVPVGFAFRERRLE